MAEYGDGGWSSSGDTLSVIRMQFIDEFFSLFAAWTKHDFSSVLLHPFLSNANHVCIAGETLHRGHVWQLKARYWLWQIHEIFLTGLFCSVEKRNKWSWRLPFAVKAMLTEPLNEDRWPPRLFPVASTRAEMNSMVTRENSVNSEWVNLNIPWGIETQTQLHATIIFRFATESMWIITDPHEILLFSLCIKSTIVVFKMTKQLSEENGGGPFCQQGYYQG